MTSLHDFDDSVDLASSRLDQFAPEGFIFGHVTSLEVIQHAEDPGTEIYKLMIDNKFGPFFAIKIPREIVNSTCLLGPQVNCGQRMLSDTSLCDEVCLSFDERNQIVEFHNQTVFDSDFEKVIEEADLESSQFNHVQFQNLDAAPYLIDAEKKIVDISDIERVSIDVFSSWLKSSYKITYNLKTIWPCEDGDFDVGFLFGTDSYGLDFHAGYVTDPKSVMHTLIGDTQWEAYQERA